MRVAPDRQEPAARRPSEADHRSVATVVDHWFGDRRVRPFATRAWFRHFGGTSWIVDAGRDAPGAGPHAFLIGYMSPDHPTEAVLHLVGVHPRHRRRGLGRGLIERFVADMAARGARTVTAVAWPDDPIATSFFGGVGFEPATGPGTQRLYGVPAFPDYEVPGEDRVVFVRSIAVDGSVPSDPTSAPADASAATSADSAAGPS
jgi:GNAT superfamily N-acetyltransferase